MAFFSETLKHLFVNDRQHGYTTPKDAPFLWIRGRQTGGRLHTFGRVLFRWSDYDFRGASKAGAAWTGPFPMPILHRGTTGWKPSLASTAPVTGLKRRQMASWPNRPPYPGRT
ncbi:hypothetical protein RAA17_10550 [Komagataeibacter rhaeticus]|nr:hypothetical protein [Komagataeibacter rhaeticus]